LEKTVLTYETLFELVMREKGREELQKLDETVYADILAYLSQKKELSRSSEMADSNEHLMQQLRNIKRLIKELYERREKKIINLALMRSRTGSDAMDLSVLLEPERMLFLSLVEKLDNARSEIIGSIISERAKPAAIEKPVEVPKPEEKTSSCVVKFLSEVPRFLGKELEVYGPFNKDEVQELPKELADLLIAREKAVYA
jgi:DNA replication initiation complex subunit (GINS family)